MAQWQWLNNVQVFTSTSGTGTLDLGDPVDGSFASAAAAGVVDGRRSVAVIQQGNDIEIVEGVFGGSGTTFTRETVLMSVIAGVVGTAKIDLDTTATVQFDVPAERFAKMAGIDLANVWGAPQKASATALTDATAWDGAAAYFLTAAVNGSDFDIANPSALEPLAPYIVRIDYATSHTVSFGTDFKGDLPVPSGASGKVDYFWFIANAAGDALEFVGASLDAGA